MSKSVYPDQQPRHGRGCWSGSPLFENVRMSLLGKAEEKFDPDPTRVFMNHGYGSVEKIANPDPFGQKIPDHQPCYG